MEEKINIAEILKDKQKEIRLYSPIFGKCCLNTIKKKYKFPIKIEVGTARVIYSFTSGGKYSVSCEDGEMLLFPSKEMRDWRKFAWKKGDVLVSNDYGTEVIFYDWYDDTYTNFYGKHHLDSENKNNIKYNDAFLCTTARYSIEDKDAAQTYINTIEERLGGKLNMETLEIDKTQPEFKDGDIIKMTWDKYSAIAIFWEYSNFGKGFDSHVFFNIKTKIIEYNIHGHTLQDLILRLATEEEKQKLFDALAKRDKAWYAEKKQIVDLKPKWITPKPFDRVITRGDNNDIWTANIFSHMNSYGEYVAIGYVGGYHYCLPYNDETAHLIGTTDEWKGGKK